MDKYFPLGSILVESIVSVLQFDSGDQRTGLSKVQGKGFTYLSCCCQPEVGTSTITNIIGQVKQVCYRKSCVIKTTAIVKYNRVRAEACRGGGVKCIPRVRPV
jgi:hypothetical protein